MRTTFIIIIKTHRTARVTPTEPGRIFARLYFRSNLIFIEHKKRIRTLPLTSRFTSPLTYECQGSPHTRMKVFIKFRKKSGLFARNMYPIPGVYLLDMCMTVLNMFVYVSGCNNWMGPRRKGWEGIIYYHRLVDRRGGRGT